MSLIQRRIVYFFCYDLYVIRLKKEQMSIMLMKLVNKLIIILMLFTAISL